MGYLIGDPHNKDYSILGSILGSPDSGTLPFKASCTGLPCKASFTGLKGSEC